VDIKKVNMEATMLSTSSSISNIMVYLPASDKQQCLG